MRVPPREIRASMWQDGGGWHGRLETDGSETFSSISRDACLAKLRRAAGDAVMTVEVRPSLAGVAETAAIMGWDKRRVIIYLNRGSFPPPFASLASGRVWLRDDVEAFATSWRERRGRRRA